MADYVTLAGNRSTVARTVGHQVRLVGFDPVRVTCACLIKAGAPYHSVASGLDPDDWQPLYDYLPHDESKAGPFTPLGQHQEDEHVR
jgi:hypothetical protein